MNHTLLQLKAALTALGVTLTTILGWKGILSLIWVIAMGIDYLSGTLAAMKNREWSSETARSGLWHKAGTILAVLAAALTDVVIYLVGQQLRLGITWTVKLGANIPNWLIKILKISLKSINAAGEPGADEQEESH